MQKKLSKVLHNTRVDSERSFLNLSIGQLLINSAVWISITSTRFVFSLTGLNVYPGIRQNKNATTAFCDYYDDNQLVMSFSPAACSFLEAIPIVPKAIPLLLLSQKISRITYQFAQSEYKSGFRWMWELIKKLFVSGKSNQ